MSLLDGLAGCWSPALGATGYTLLDRSGRGNHGTLTNMDAGTDWVGSQVNGRAVTALDFDGVNDYVTTKQVGLSTTHSTFAWIYCRGQSGQYNFGGIVGEGNSNTCSLYVAGQDALTISEIGYTIATGNYSVTGLVLKNRWILAGTTRSGTSVSVYINGQVIGSGTLPANSDFNLSVIGTRQTSFGFFNGLVSDFGVWNRVINNVEAQFIYQLGPGYLGQQLTGQFNRRRAFLSPVTIANITGSSSVTFATSGTLAGSGEITGSSSITFAASATLSGSSAITGSSSVTFTVSGALAGAGDLVPQSPAVQIKTLVAGTLDGAAAITGSSSLTLATSGTLAGSGAITGTSSITLATSGTLTGSGAITASSSVTFSTSGTLTDLSTQSGSSSLTFATSGTLDGAAAITGTSSLTLSTSATLTATGTLTSTSAITFDQSGTITSDGAISGSAAIAFGQTGLLAGSGACVGASALAVSGAGEVVGAGVLSGVVGLVLAQSGDLAGTGYITAASSVTFTLDGLMESGIPPSVPGAEYTAPDDRLHYSATGPRLHYTAPEE